MSAGLGDNQTANRSIAAMPFRLQTIALVSDADEAYVCSARDCNGGNMAESPSSQARRPQTFSMECFAIRAHRVKRR